MGRCLDASYPTIPTPLKTASKRGKKELKEILRSPAIKKETNQTELNAHGNEI
jgi:hypothetical protein